MELVTNNQQDTMNSDNEVLLGSTGINKPQYQVLLVFPKEDRYYRLLCAALNKLGFKHDNVKTTEDAQKKHFAANHHLIIVDCRHGCNVEAETFCRNMRSAAGGGSVGGLTTEMTTTIVALTVHRRNYRQIRSQNDETLSIKELLRVGFNRVITETMILDEVEDELLQIEAEPLANQTKFRSCQALFTALERTPYSIVIVDAKDQIQYVNKSFERRTGLMSKQLLETSIAQMIVVVQQHATSSVDVTTTATAPSTSNNQNSTSLIPSTSSMEDITKETPPPSTALSSTCCWTWERIKEALQHGKEWCGMLKIRHHLSEKEMTLKSRILPLSGKNPDSVQQYVFVMNQDQDEHLTNPANAAIPTNLATVDPTQNQAVVASSGTSTSSAQSGSSNPVYPGVGAIDPTNPMLSTRRTSTTSEGDCKHNRANSLAKIQSMAIEAPITQIINLIERVKHNSQPSVGEVLDQILEILRNSELYSPADIQNKTQDPMVSDLIGGLVTGPSFGHRRSSGGQNIVSKSAVAALTSTAAANSSICASGGSSSTAVAITEEVEASSPHLKHDPSLDVYLKDFESWDYNIFELERITMKKPLVNLGMHALNKFNVCDVLKCSQNTLHSWLAGIESKYHASNPYHNSTHAADVLHATAYFLNKERLQSWMDPTDQAAILLAAIIHDVDHPGKTNAFLINTSDPLARMYNDTAVLEMHHAAFAFNFTVNGGEESNIFRNMPRENYMTLRQSMIDMVLATELTKHFEHVNKFVSIVTKSSALVLDQQAPAMRSDRASSGANSKETQDLKNLIKRVMIKVADVCNPIKNRKLCTEWTRRVSEEYFAQTDAEKALGLTPSLPLFDRHTCNLPKSQSSFMEWFLIDMCEAWHEFCGIEELVFNLHNNFNYWRLLESHGIKKLEEIEGDDKAPLRAEIEKKLKEMAALKKQELKQSASANSESANADDACGDGDHGDMKQVDYATCDHEADQDDPDDDVADLIDDVVENHVDA